MANVLAAIRQRVHRPTTERGRLWLAGTLYFALSRVFVMAGAAVYSVIKTQLNPATNNMRTTPTRDVLNVLTSWDGQWYLRVMQTGYPRHVPTTITYATDEARVVFFPLYPRLAHIIDRFLPGGPRVAALGLAWGAGALAVALIGYLAYQHFGSRVALRSIALVSLFPGSFVLSFAYSEGLMFVLVALTLLLLHRRMWLLAGLAAALTTLSRPNALAICAACLIASFDAIRQRREWESIIAPVLSPLGYIGFQIFLARHTGETFVWFRVQHKAWNEGFSLGFATVKVVGKALLHPFSSPGHDITILVLVLAVLMVWRSWRAGLPRTWWAYSVVILFFLISPSTVGPRPRYLLTAFPLLIGTAAGWPEEDRDVWPVVLSILGALLVALVAVYGGAGAVP
jgi:Gpi18-like mannosyltransferase